MTELMIDLEVYNSLDITKCGVHRYAQGDDLEILLFAYSVDGGPVQVVDLASGETIPRNILNAIKDQTVTKWAFNAQFERVCLSRYLGEKLPVESFKCSMVYAAELGYPLKLQTVGEALHLDKKKLDEGRRLIDFFCKPCRPGKSNGYRVRNMPWDAPAEWELFKEYNKRDVETELEIHEKLSRFPVPESEWNNYHLDQVINDRGVMVDLKLVESAIKCNALIIEEKLEEAKALTGLANPNSTQQLQSWLRSNGVETESLDKKAVAQLVQSCDGDVLKVLRIRQLLSKSSIKKYEAMLNCMCDDRRIRGLFQFYGGHTGRFAGRLVQVQNLPQNHIDNIEDVREMTRRGYFDSLDKMFDSVPDTLSQLIRTALVPKAGCHFNVADYAAIEARVIAWYSGESWRLKSFAAGEDIYCASASKMFGVPVEKHGQNSHLRAKGKIAELALGYGGSVGALVGMGALEMGLDEDELKPLVDAWRLANRNITRFWWNVDAAAKIAIRKKTTTRLGRLFFEYKPGFLFIKLPSGRKIAYPEARLGINRFGSESIIYKGLSTNRKWMDIDTYGPKLVENIVQATARDLLVEAMVRLEANGYPIVMHIHDEVVVETDREDALDDICKIMAETPDWADSNLLLRADGFVSDFYMKD